MSFGLKRSYPKIALGTAVIFLDSVSYTLHLDREGARQTPLHPIPGQGGSKVNAPTPYTWTGRQQGERPKAETSWGQLVRMYEADRGWLDFISSFSLGALAGGNNAPRMQSKEITTLLLCLCRGQCRRAKLSRPLAPDCLFAQHGQLQPLFF